MLKAVDEELSAFPTFGTETFPPLTLALGFRVEGPGAQVRVKVLWVEGL